MNSLTRIVLQVRLGSGRLPGKALLPIANIPMFVLAARRAARNGMELVVATSNNPFDDLIARICDTVGLPVFRGALDDVYSRFMGVTAKLPDDAIVVRLTADNVFPDADLIDELVGMLRSNGESYIAPKWPDSGLPYGIAAEAFRLGALRRCQPKCAEDAEHVTLALVRASTNLGFQAGISLSHLRATVDCLEDYFFVYRSFEGISDPIGIGWQDLCIRLAALKRVSATVSSNA